MTRNVLFASLVSTFLVVEVVVVHGRRRQRGVVLLPSRMENSLGCHNAWVKDVSAAPQPDVDEPTVTT